MIDSHILFAFLAYILVLLTIGIVVSKKQTTSTEFIMGNRSLNFWLTALSAHASDMSAWLFMAFPAAIYIGGLQYAWIAIGLLLGMFMNWQFVAKKLRIATEKYESYTLSTFFENRYKDKSGALRTLTATMSIIFLSCYLSAGLMAMGLVFESVFFIDYYLGLTIATFVIVLYTFMGGYITVAWTDLFQALFLLCMIIIVPIQAYLKLDNGLENILEAAKLQSIPLTMIPSWSLTSLLTILFICSWGLGYFGQPHIVTKFMGINDADDTHKSKYVGMTWEVIALTASATVGVIGIAYFAEGSLNKKELIFVEMVKSLFPSFIAGFILCGLVAANLSTMASQILVCGSVWSEDIYKHLIKREASQKDLLKITRIGVVLTSVAALLVAFNKNASILDSVLYAWTGLGCAFGPLVLTSLYSTKVNKYGAIAGIIVGGGLAGGWQYINPYFTELAIPAMIPGFILSIITIYSVSLLTSEKDKELIHL
jgi:sodium/proline symporter